MEANTEVYHVPNIHPTTVAPYSTIVNVNTLYANGHGRMVAPPPRINETKDANLRGMLVPALRSPRWAK